MSDVALDENHDIDVSNQEMHLVVDEVDDPQAIAQEMRIGMQFNFGEWPLNVLMGIPFLSQVFIKNPSLAALSFLFTRAARSIPGVLVVQDMSLIFDNDTRELEVDYAATAQNGGVIEDTIPLLLT